MKLLFDTSAIAKRYKREQGHEAVVRWLGQAQAVVVAAHCRTEVASALCRELHDGTITAAQYAHTMVDVTQDFADFDVQGITPDIEAHAIAAMQRSRLRAMDALHIGTAIAARVDCFITADARQAQAAQMVGLKTEWIAP